MPETPALPAETLADALHQVQDYHQRTKHHLNAYARGPETLDWDAQPNPFRQWIGTDVVALPLANAATEPDTPWPAWAEPRPARPIDRASLGLFLELSLALAAWKQAGLDRWAVRINPSSGNLHPTEGWLWLHGLPSTDPELCDGLYHYAPHAHALERRAAFAPLARSALGDTARAWVALSSIHWREAWKYGERAWRYCQLDNGHAQAALALAAGALGWQVRQLDTLDDLWLDAIFGLDRGSFHEQEQVEALLWVGAPQTQSFDLPASLVRDLARQPLQGEPNRLSVSYQHWPQLEQMLELCRAPRQAVRRWNTAAGLRTWDNPQLALRPLLHQRRSAQAFDGQSGIELAQLRVWLQRLLPEGAPMLLDIESRAAQVDLLLFVHRVQGLTPGLYWLDRSGSSEEERRTACGSFHWQRADAALPLYRLQGGDARNLAGFLSCGQAIGRDGCLTVSMLGRFEDALAEGGWGYASLLRECGRIGQLLYLEAEAAGLSGTGMGCFFDPLVHELLGMQDSRWQSLYHFTLGKALWDERLTTLPAYPQRRWPPVQADTGL